MDWGFGSIEVACTAGEILYGLILRDIPVVEGLITDGVAYVKSSCSSHGGFTRVRSERRTLLLRHSVTCPGGAEAGGVVDD